MTSHIPIVDFSALSIVHEQRPAVNSDAVQQLAKEIDSAFSTVGFVYLKNHGISLDEIDHVLQTTDAFFNKSSEIKSRYEKKSSDCLNGWDEIERESPNPKRPGDLKESFDIAILESKDFTWPGDAVVPNFKSTIHSFYGRLQDLGFRVLSAVAIGLNLDPDVFQDPHKGNGTEDGCTILRFNYYPKITDNIRVKPGQIRCGEHTDYGSITLLIQDDAGGLEVCNQENNQFEPATPIEGTILVNIADLMQRWTSDQLKSTLHRVIVPEDELRRGKPRRSTAFFLIPDSEALITCLDGSDKYPPVKAGDYLRDILNNTYKF